MSSEILGLLMQGIRKSTTRAHERFRNKKRRHINDDTSSLRTVVNPDLPQEYQVKVFTGDVPYASTSANVFIVLVTSPVKESEAFTLNADADVNKDPAHFRFQRAQCDTFKVSCPPMGEIARIRIGHDGTGTGAGWFLEKVEVTDLSTGAEFTFPCGRWLSIDMDDYQLVRELEVEHSTTLLPRDFSNESADEFEVASNSGMTMNVKDFAPKVFRNIREFFGIHTTDYLESWTLPDDKLQLKEGAGRSGSLFLRSNDGKYMLKTIPRDEVTTFLEILPQYYEHLSTNRDTLIMKVIGLQRYRTRARIGDTWAIIFCNCLWTPDAEAMNTMAVFDLKGRRAKPGKALQNMNRGPGYVFKDKDLNRKFFLNDDTKSSFLTRMAKDIKFFQNMNLMDYSFLIGVSKQSPDADVEYPDWVYVLESLPELNEHYHVGFIDCLTNYGFKKKTAHMFKSALWNVDTLSTINAPLYAERIKRYLFSLFESNLNSASASAPALRPVAQVRRGSWWATNEEDGDNLLAEKKLEFLERKVYRLENNVMLLSSLIGRLLDERDVQDQSVHEMLAELRRNPSIGSLVSFGGQQRDSIVHQNPRGRTFSTDSSGLNARSRLSTSSGPPNASDQNNQRPLHSDSGGIQINIQSPSSLRKEVST